MAQVTGIGTSWNLPNYAGELFTADPGATPFLSMIGGLSGGMQTESSEFPTAVTFDYPAAAQPDISEEAAVTAPAAGHTVREQETNVVQIHQEVIDITYTRQSNAGRMSGLNLSGAGSVGIADEKTWQIEQKLAKIARDVEYSFLCGAFQKSTAANVANKTRGMLELVSANSVDAGNAALSQTLLKKLFLSMAEAGAYFDRCVLFCGAKQKQALSALYEKTCGVVNSSIGGVNVTEIETDFCRAAVVWDRFMPADALLVADVAHIYPVFQAVPGKGVLFEEPLSKTGASDRVQIFGQIGLAHGPAFLHGAIRNLK